MLILVAGGWWLVLVLVLLLLPPRPPLLIVILSERSESKDICFALPTTRHPSERPGSPYCTRPCAAAATCGSATGASSANSRYNVARPIPSASAVRNLFPFNRPSTKRT